MRNHQTVFHSGCIILHSHQWGIRVLISLQTFIFHFFWIIAILMGVKWHLIVSPLFLKDNFTACRILGCRCFLSDVKDFAILSSSLHCFQQQICHHLYLSNTVYNVSLSQSTFKIFCMSFVLSKLIMICLGVVFFMFLLFGIHLASWICIVFNIIGKFWAIVF